MLTLLFARWYVRDCDSEASWGTSSKLAHRGMLDCGCRRHSLPPSTVTRTECMREGWKLSGS